MLPYTVAIGGQLRVAHNEFDTERKPPPPVNVPPGTRGLNAYQKKVVPTLLRGKLLGGRTEKPASYSRDEL